MASTAKLGAAKTTGMVAEEREWRSADGGVKILFSPKAMEQARFEASRAMNGPGNHGIGGVLLGTRLGNLYKVQRFQILPCEHAMGPDFRLSESDEAAATALISELQSNAGINDPQLLGWLVSHPRNGLEMTEEESALRARLLPQCEFTVVVKPDRLGDMDVSVYLAGASQPKSAPFTVRPDTRFRPDGRPRRPPLGGPRGDSSTRNNAPIIEMPPPAAPVDTPEPLIVPVEPQTPVVAAPSANRWLWPMLVILSAVFGAGAYYYWERFAAPAVSAPRHVTTLGVHASEEGGKFYVSWNSGSEDVKSAAGGALEIQDGGQTTRWEMSPDELKVGGKTYQRQSSEVRITLSLRYKNGSQVEENTRFQAADFRPGTVLRVTHGGSDADGLPVASEPETRKK